MKSSFFLYLSIFLFLQLIININTKNKTKSKKGLESKSKKEESENITEIKEDSKGEEEEGHMMTDEEFDTKLQEILKEKRIRKNMKITKDKLKEIFEEMYGKDFALPNLPEDNKEGEIDINPEEESKRILNEMFNNLQNLKYIVLKEVY